MIYLLSESLLSGAGRGRGHRAHAWDLKQYVRHEEYHDQDGVTIAHSELQVFCHAGHESQAEICSIDERYRVHDTQYRQQAEVNTPSGKGESAPWSSIPSLECDLT